MYDVVVVGAGPSGATAAKIAAEKGYKTLLVEKFKMPRYKSCSGQLIKKTLDLVQRYYGESIPQFAMCAPQINKGMILTDDTGKQYKFEQNGLNVWRSEFDNWLALKAVASGAELRDSTAALSYIDNGDSVTLNLKGQTINSVEARYVVDCEGVIGSIKRQIMGHSGDYVTTFQTYNIGTVRLDHSYFYAFLQPELSEYDAWMNVKDDQIVLGVCVVDPKKIDYYYNKFIDYMIENHSLNIDRQIKVDKWLMPRVRPGCRIDIGVRRVLFAGEIAGFLNPMGEGISAAIESGNCAACAIAAHYDDPEAVRTHYQQSTAELADYMKRQWSFAARMSHKFDDMKI